MSIKQNLNKILSKLPEYVSLVAVTKTKSVSDIMQAYNAGHRIFGENKIQEMTEKYNLLPKDIEWHMIGHVQRNKVKYMADFVSLIHGVDNYKVLQEIDKQAKKHNRIISCLLQIRIATEDSKYGLSEEEAKHLVSSREFLELKNVKVKGVMGMATFTSDYSQIKEEFLYLKKIFDELKSNSFTNADFEIISMGMSGDYQLAVDCGSNMVRIGSSIFGARN